MNQIRSIRQLSSNSNMEANKTGLSEAWEKVKIVDKTLSSSFYKPATTEDLVGKTMRMYCSDDESPNLFHLQLDLWSPSYHLLNGEMEMNNDVSLLTELYIGAPCLAYLSLEKKWCRAEVVYFAFQDDIQVRLVDYGPVISVGPDQLYDISKKSAHFREMPKLCFPCVVADVAGDYEWSDKMREQFFQHLSGVVEVQVMNKKNDDTFVVRPFVQYKALIEYLGITKFILYPTRNDETFANKRHYLGSTEDDAFVCYIESPELFYVQLERWQEKFSHITYAIKAGQQLLPVEKCNPGTRCIFFDQVWRRGKVCNVSEEGILVQFVDFGKKITLRADQIFDIANQPRRVRKNTGLCFQCKLYGIGPLENGKWGDEAKQLMESWFSCKSLDDIDMKEARNESIGTVRFHHMDGEKFVVGFNNKGDTIDKGSIQKYLVEQGQATYVQNTMLTPMMGNTESLELNKGSLLDICENRAMCAWVDTPDKFTITLHHWRFHHLEMGKKHGNGQLSQLKIGDKCRVKVKDGTEHIPAEIVKFENDKAVIRTLDCGETFNCPMNELRKLGDQTIVVRDIFSGSVLCRLAHVSPLKRRSVSRKWPKPVVDWFVEMVSNRQLNVHFLALGPDGVYEVELATEHCQSVSSEMVQKGFAKNLG